MPRSKASKAANTGWEKSIFVNFKLSSEEKKDFKAWVSKQGDNMGSELAIFISEGNKTSISWDDENKCYIVSSTCKDDGSANYNHCMTSRSQDWFEAMAMNLYKATEIAAGEPWASLVEDSDWG